MTENAPLRTPALEGPAERRKGHPVWLALKTAVSLGLIVVVFWKLNLAAVWETSRHLSVVVIISVVLMFTAQTYVAAWRWWVILRHQRVEMRFLTTVRISFIGAFFNQLLPSSIGGDVARAWYVHRAGYSRGTSVITVLADRIYGMLLLACLAIVFFPVLILFSVAREALLVIGVLIGGASLALIAVFWLDRLGSWMQRWSFVRHSGALSRATRAIMADGRSSTPVLALSLIIHTLTIVAIVILLWTVAPQVNLTLCAALVPVIMLMAMVPVSIAGWGVREGAMVYGLGLANVPREAALIVSIVVGLSLAAVGLAGGVVWLMQNNRIGPRQPVV
jgi:uncharacterized protein (TIRG00374 family)